MPASTLVVSLAKPTFADIDGVMAALGTGQSSSNRSSASRDSLADVLADLAADTSRR
jgi:hypothetical protein